MAIGVVFVTAIDGIAVVVVGKVGAGEEGGRMSRRRERRDGSDERQWTRRDLPRAKVVGSESEAKGVADPTLSGTTLASVQNSTR